MRTIITTLTLLALSFIFAPEASSPVVTGVDDPNTIVNESVVLDPSRVISTGDVGDIKSSMELAKEYASTHNLTSCTTPDQAELDDVFLTRSVHPVDGQTYNEKIVPVDLDTALDSAGKRVVILACSQ